MVGIKLLVLFNDFVYFFIIKIQLYISKTPYNMSKQQGTYKERYPLQQRLKLATDEKHK